MFKRTLFAGAAAAILATPAFAADMPAYEPAPAPAPSAPSPIFYDWTGVYGGIAVGYGWGSYDVTAAPSFDFDGNGFLAGGTLGSNWQSGQFVFGLEGDMSWAGMDGSTIAPWNDRTLSVKNRWYGTLRGRAGVAIDEILLYGTGGVAATRINASDPVASSTNTHTGWTLGGGIEAGLMENVSAKVEYLYSDFGNRTYHLDNGPTRIDNSSHIVRTGVNYRFSW